MSPWEKHPLIDDPEEYVRRFNEGSVVGQRAPVACARGAGLSLWIAKTDAGLVVQLEAEPWASTKDVRAAESVFMAWRKRVEPYFADRLATHVMRRSMEDLVRLDVGPKREDAHVEWKKLADHYNEYLANLVVHEPSSWGFHLLLEALGTSRDDAERWWTRACENAVEGKDPFPPGEPVNWKDIRNRFRPDK